MKLENQAGVSAPSAGWLTFFAAGARGFGGAFGAAAFAGAFAGARGVGTFAAAFVAVLVAVGAATSTPATSSTCGTSGSASSTTASSTTSGAAATTRGAVAAAGRDVAACRRGCRCRRYVFGQQFARKIVVIVRAASGPLRPEVGLLLVRPQHHDHVSAVELGCRFDETKVDDVFGEPLK